MYPYVLYSEIRGRTKGFEDLCLDLAEDG
jgi:hypothetical protein